MTVSAQEPKVDKEPKADSTARPAKWYENIKFSGYGMLQYQFEDKEGNNHNEFNLRLMRMMLDGKISDFDWRIQIQGTSNKGPGEPTVQLIDLYVEWAKYKEARIRVGQFKRAFTFENPTNPVTQGWYAYANVINALCGFGDVLKLNFVNVLTIPIIIGVGVDNGIHMVHRYFEDGRELRPHG